MSNHLNQKGSRRIGIIGGGVSGLSAAYFLDESARLDVTLHERLDRLGGNALTVDAKTPEGKPFAVDPVAYLFVTDRYPYFTTWLKQLGVKTLPLSFENYLWNGFTQTGTLITSNLKKVFFYPGRSLRYFRNLFLFKKLIQTINKLEKQGRIHDRMLLGEFMALVPGMDDVFKLEVFYPLMSFAFHTDFDTLDDKPCAAILRSYACAGNNPGGLYCVDGGIRQYIQKVHQALGKTQVIMNSSVVAVRKSDQPVSAWEVTTADGTTHLYDEVIMALWPNQAAELLRKGFEQGKPDEELQKMEEVLAKVELAYCRATVHNDVSSMPE
ncbi:MAG TPA: FAD-dependent oxidoreductase, partial [Bacteroidia bacterium]|nr:FAD-dependent oxidoreductase [Bacteroidia bacterium]